MAYIELIQQPEAPSAVVRHLKQIDPNLNLRFIEFPADQEGNKPRWWAVIYEWDKNDPRFRLVERGDIARGGTFDVLGYLPLDCGVHDSFDYIKRMLYQARNIESTSHLLNRVDDYNKVVTDKAIAPVAERAGEMIEANAAHLFAKETGKKVPKVFVNAGKN